MSVRAALVSTVGTNPMPAVLAALTSHHRQVAGVPLDRVVLLHSGGQPTSGSAAPQRPGTASTRFHAERVAALLTQLLPDVSVECQTIGVQVSDLDVIVQRVTRALDGVVSLVSEPVLIDYTGGTKAMAAGLVSWHLTHDDQEAWGPVEHRQLYVDETAGVLRAAGRWWQLSALGLTLQNMAELHGFVMDIPDRPRGAATKGQRHESNAFTKIKNKVDAHTESCLKCPEELRDDYELLDGRELRPAGQSRLRDASAEVDVLLRSGHRVSIVEVKAQASDLENSLGWSITRAKAAFGGATNVVFLSADSVYDLRPYRGALNTSIGSTRGAPLYSKVKFPNFHDLIPAIKPPAQAAASIPEPGKQSAALIVSAVGDSRIAPLTSATCALPDEQHRQILLLSSSQAQGVIDKTKDVIQTMHDDASSVRADHRRIDTGDAAAITQWLEQQISVADPTLPLVLDATAGTKAVTAAMTTVHHRHPQRSRLVYLDPRARTRSELTAGIGPLPRYHVPWERYFTAAWTRCEIADLAARSPYLHLITAAAVRAATDAGWNESPPEILVPPEGKEPAPGRPTAVLLFGDRLLGLTEGRVRHRMQPATFSTGKLLSTGIQLNQALMGVAGEAVATILTWNPWDEAMRDPNKAGGWRQVNYGSMRRRLHIVRSTGQSLAVAEPDPDNPDTLKDGAERIIGVVVDSLIRSVVRS